MININAVCVGVAVALCLILIIAIGMYADWKDYNKGRCKKCGKKMILFDYGRTLLYQPEFCTSNGNKAIYPYINRNPRNISLEEYDKTDVLSKLLSWWPLHS